MVSTDDMSDVSALDQFSRDNFITMMGAVPDAALAFDADAGDTPVSPNHIVLISQDGVAIVALALPDIMPFVRLFDALVMTGQAEELFVCGLCGITGDGEGKKDNNVVRFRTYRFLSPVGLNGFGLVGMGFIPS